MIPSVGSDPNVVLRALSELLPQDNHASLRRRIDEELGRIQAQTMYLAVLGQFKRGKTTFINALLGEELLPTGVLPVTAIVTLIRYGEERQCTVVYQDGRQTVAPQSALHDLITEAGNPGNEKNIQHVKIVHPCALLREGIVLIDTPGIGSLYGHNTETTRTFIPRIDAGIIVLSADLPVTESEFNFFKEAAEHVPAFFFVMNKADVLESEDLAKTIGYAHSVLNRVTETNHTSIFPLSARQALQSRLRSDNRGVEQSNILDFEQHLASFLQRGKERVLMEGSSRRATVLVSEARFAVELEIQALSTPLKTLEEKIAAFNDHVESLKKEQEDFSYLLEGRIKKLTADIENSLHTFGQEETKRLQKALESLASDISALRPSEFLTKVEELGETVLVTDFEEWRSIHEPGFVRDYDAILSEFVEKTRLIIREIHETATRYFVVSIPDLDDVKAVEWKRTFYYKLDKDRTFFQMDVLSLLSRIVPRAMANRLLLHRVRDGVESKVMQNCNRLQYEYGYSIQEHYRGFRYDMRESLTDVIGQLTDILRIARDRKQGEESSVSPRLESLSTRADKLRMIDVRREAIQ
jgi:GTPase Era involved in 16S rRNA processing/archaellum component FlaC